MIKRSAEISKCGRYRWWLQRVLNNDNNRCVCFVMLNCRTEVETMAAAEVAAEVKPARKRRKKPEPATLFAMQE